MFWQMILAALALFFGVMLVLYVKLSQRGLRWFCLGLLIAWAGAIAYLTVLSRAPVLGTRMHWLPLVEMHFYSFAENVAVFLPLGALLAGIAPRMKKRFAVLWGAGASLAIELIQLITHRGVWDVDDLVANTLGAALGVAAWVILRRLVKRG